MTTENPTRGRAIEWEDFRLPPWLIGVIGGTLSLGLLGLFIGPVILALFYEMVTTWIAFEAKGLDPATGDPLAPTPAE